MISEIAKVAAEERLLLEKSRDLLSTVAAMHVSADTVYFLLYLFHVMLVNVEGHVNR